MSRPVRLLALIAGAAIAAGLAAPAQATVPDAPGHTPVSFPTRTVTDASGNTLLADARGRAMQLHGANLGKVDDITERDVADLAAAGLTLLRLPIQWSKLEPTEGAYDPTFVEHVQDVLSWAQTYGMLVIVDWHQDVFGPAFNFNGIPEWATRTDGLPFEEQPGNWFLNYFQPAVQAAFNHLWNDDDLRDAQVAAWTYLAQQLAGSPALLGYDLFNEPMAGTVVPSDVADLDNLTAVAIKALKFESTELADMYRRVIAGIRTVDQRSWLWVEPTVLVGEGLPTRLPAFDDPRTGANRIGYAPHAYDTDVEDGMDFDPASGWVKTYESSITSYPRTNHMPVIVGEWGPIQAGGSFPGNTALVAQQAASFRHFASGWAIWYGCRSATGNGYCIMSDDEGNLDPGRAAAWRPYPLALAGKRVSEAATSKSYKLTYRPKAKVGGTEIVVPSGFGARLAVQVRDGGHRPKGARVSVSPTSATGARTVVVKGHGHRGATWTVTVTPR